MKMKSTTRSQLRKGDRPWEGRSWKICQTMDKNRIQGRGRNHTHGGVEPVAGSSSQSLGPDSTWVSMV